MFSCEIIFFGPYFSLFRLNMGHNVPERTPNLDVFSRRGYESSFYGKIGVLCFLVTPVLRFALLPYYRRLSVKFDIVITPSTPSPTRPPPRPSNPD